MSVAGPALSCPSCRRTLDPLSWHDGHSGSCRRCQCDFEWVEFPAFRAERTVNRPQAAVVEADATCFFHAENQAESVCESCGRYLCAVCAVDFGGRKSCPSCIATTKQTSAQAADSRVLYDGIALSAALVPLLMWPVTLVTAPAALGMAIYGWKKPASLVRGKRPRLVIAIVLATLQIGGWCAVFVNLALS